MDQSSPDRRELLQVDRFATAELETALARLEGTPLVAEGKVGLISLDAVRHRLGERWPARQTVVHDLVDRTLSRHLAVGGWFARISEVEYLIVQPALERYAAQASCLMYLRGLLVHLLGQVDPSDLKVSEVGSLSNEGLYVRQLDRAEITAAAAGEQPRGATANADDGVSLRVDNPFVAAGGERLRVSCGLEPVYRLADFVQIGYRLNRRVVDERSGMPLTDDQLSRLTTSDLEKVDLTTLARGINRLRSGNTMTVAPLLTVPVSFSTLASQKARRALAGSLQKARATTNVRLFCAVTRLEGVPANALYTAVGMMKPFCDGVIGGVASPRKSAAALRDMGLAGIAFDYDGPSGEASMERMAQAMAPAVDAALAAFKFVTVLGLRSPRELGVAGLLGATHASLRGAKG
jgi:hypothetical protein